MNRSKIKIKAGIFLALLLFGCTRNNRNFAELKDANFRVQMARVVNNAHPDTSSAVFRIRITPTETFKTIHKDFNTKHYWYQMDSCFYISAHGQKGYPVVVQPIANGSHDNYEYLVQFAREKGMTGTDSATLVFADPAVGRSSYQFKIAF